MVSLYLLKFFVIYAFVLLISVHVSAGQQPVCGPTLDLVLDTICKNGFNIKFKKSMQWEEIDNTDNAEKLPFALSNFPFLSNIHGGQVDTLAKTRRRRQGVYDECCRKSCTYNELYSYCN